MISSADALLALEPEELGAKLLFLLRKRQAQGAKFHLRNMTSELWANSNLPAHLNPYPRERREAIDLAIAEAWAWLEAQGLLVAPPDGNGQNGWRVLSRRAQRFASETEFANYAVARLIQKDALNPKIAEKVWMAFMRGEFDVAVFQAMKAVEMSVREAAGYGDEKFGVPMMREAFSPGKGPLVDSSAEAGEQVACMELFAGAIGSYKNPQSHRDVDLGDPVEAAEIIFLANHLLRIVDARVRT